MTMKFTEIQKKMQIPKTKKGDVKYAFRNAEQIETHFKKETDGWILTFKDEIKELAGRLFYISKSIVEEEDTKVTYESFGIAELGEVPIIVTKAGKTIQQMQVPQWTGAVGSYARKYALQGLFAMGEEDVDSFQKIGVEEFDKITALLEIKCDTEDKMQSAIAYICKQAGVTKLEDLLMNQLDSVLEIIGKLGNKG
ncbi:ERF family protein [Streptococcus iniae]|uniref:ERF family protein n=1 Tax=Streptococcus iniae TaxID=1346 RepID=UPI000EFD80C1|nr:ERF family protein [Streptococcus iniae]RMI77632.1 single-stranded DNA-binding protein [Streptococcus iniae]WLR88560.1 ERF family protein [Streptococcus iniae]